MTAAIIPMKWSENGNHNRPTPPHHCAACGKPINGEPKYWVEVIDGGGSVAHPGLGPDTNDPGYMGFWAVGPECARKYFRGFTHAG